jgi:Transglutaminase-like superfamily
LRAALATWHRFRNLSASSRGLTVEAAVALLLTWVGLRLVGLRLWRFVLERSLGRSIRRLHAQDSAVLAAARFVARFEQAAARHLPVRTSCLERSLVLCWLLARRGIGARLRLGARQNQGRFEAHAWVEVCGAVLDDRPSDDFRPFDQPTTSLETGNP